MEGKDTGECTPLKGARQPQATVLGTGFNIFKNIVGAGLLGLPYAVSQMGLAGLAFMAYSVTVSMVALYFIMCSIDISRRLGTAKPYSYKAIAIAAFGDSAGVLVDVIIMFYTGFELVAYGVLVVDFFGPPLEDVLHQPVAPALILTVAGTAVFGLCCLPTVEALKYSSLLGNIALFYTVLLVAHEWWTAPVGVAPDVVAVAWTPAAFRVAGIFTAAFNFHYNMPVFYAGMQPCTPRRMMSVISVVYAVVLACYVPLALCGYLTFGGAVQSNILRNFSEAPRFLACRLGLGLMVLCTFPLIAICTRLALGRLLLGDPPTDYTSQVIFSFLIVVTACSLACVVPSFGVVLAYNGAIFGTLQQLIFPSAAFLALSKHADVPAGQRLLAAAVCGMGVLVAVVGTTTETLNLWAEGPAA